MQKERGLRVGEVETSVARSTVVLDALWRAGSLACSVGRVVSGIRLGLTLIVLWVLLWRVRTQWRRCITAVLPVSVLRAEVRLWFGRRRFRADRHAVR